MKLANFSKFSASTLLTIAAICSLPSIASAETFKCAFTEPFIDMKIDTKTNTVTYSSMGSSEATVISDVDLVIDGSGVFSIKKGTKQIAMLILNNHGSDGMSETVYPFDIRWEGKYGGCSTYTMFNIRQ